MKLVIQHAPDPRRAKRSNEVVDVSPLRLVQALVKAKRAAACAGLREATGGQGLGGEAAASANEKTDEQQKRQQRRRRQQKKNSAALLGGGAIPL